MTETTARLALPLIVPGQAQKEMTHNEALALLDIVAGGSVQAAGINVPPTDPAPGACWILGDAPVGAWAGQARAVAGWTEGGWRFVAPWEGLRLWVVADGLEARFAGGAWRRGELRGDRLVLGGVARLGGAVVTVAQPAGGTTVDAEARATIAALLAALRGHGLVS